MFIVLIGRHEVIFLPEIIPSLIAMELVENELQLDLLDRDRGREYDIDVTQASGPAVIQEGIRKSVEPVKRGQGSEDLGLAVVGTENFVSELDQSDRLEIETR